jgi:hypothetical protein
MIIRAITKSSKKVMDKYTVYFYDNTCLTLSSNPDSPQGVSMFGESFGVHDAVIEEVALEGKKLFGSETMINFFELPSVIQAHIEKRIAGV